MKMGTTIAEGNFEWLGVTEIIDKKKNALYRANSTTLVLVVMFLIVYLILPSVTEVPASSSPMLVLLFGALISVIWGVSFAFGYAGLSYVSTYGIRPDR